MTEVNILDCCLCNVAVFDPIWRMDPMMLMYIQVLGRLGLCRLQT